MANESVKQSSQSNDETLIVRLHHAARRYCMDSQAKWCERYAEIVKSGQDREPDGCHYTEEALVVYPRYNVLAAILEELERLRPETISNLREALIKDRFA